ncbi:HlyD family secretion protein [Pedobacter cryoconitis]|uniref:Membrane fusion protein (Multidrug efflux system) n=1 Tax=Pedobacter cryoconitis TaxID=188932 RepID=A0A7X0J6I6_9SPHI|nr:HlyD family secretion protein [Pedobacter cryoconitis]MBB6502019.1 membrane fusion protein (multidrug efflux system) [Pedobacter cryoconitis]
MEENVPKKNNKKLVIGGLLAILLVIFTINSYISGLAYETTDNAQLDGDLLPVKAGITGYIAEIRFKDNQEVKTGDTLIVFNTTELNAEASQIRAELENARLNVDVSGNIAEASIQSANAAVFESTSNEQGIQSAKATYDKSVQDFNRARQLLGIKAITQNGYEQAQTQMDVAKAAYFKAKAMQLSSSSSSSGLKTRAMAERKQVSVARNVILRKQAELAAALERLRHACIIAPFGGIVTKRNVQTGQFVIAGQSLCAIINHKDLWVTANFKETQMGKIRTGQKVQVTVDAYEEKMLTGTIDSYGGATGSRFALIPPDNATGNFIKIAQRFPVKIKLDPQTGNGQLYPGLSVLVKVKVN